MQSKLHEVAKPALIQEHSFSDGDKNRQEIKATFISYSHSFFSLSSVLGLERPHPPVTNKIKLCFLRDLKV